MRLMPSVALRVKMISSEKALMKLARMVRAFSRAFVARAARR